MLPIFVLAGLALIVLATSLSYFPSLSGGFIWDDKNIFLVENRIVKIPDGLYKFWCTNETTDYWPLTYSSFWIEWRLWGLSPAGYRVTNLILHIIESLLIWIILRRLSIPGAFLAALIFALHPVNVESVAWIAERKDMLAVLFFLLSIMCYLKEIQRTMGGGQQTWGRLQEQKNTDTAVAYSRRGTRKREIMDNGRRVVYVGKWYWLSLGGFVLAMLCKGSVAILPVILLGIILWMGALTWRDFVRVALIF